jgi:hypothetical protein
MEYSDFDVVSSFVLQPVRLKNKYANDHGSMES